MSSDKEGSVFMTILVVVNDVTAANPEEAVEKAEEMLRAQLRATPNIDLDSIEDTDADDEFEDHDEPDDPDAHRA